MDGGDALIKKKIKERIALINGDEDAGFRKVVLELEKKRDDDIEKASYLYKMEQMALAARHEYSMKAISDVYNLAKDAQRIALVRELEIAMNSAPLNSDSMGSTRVLRPKNAKEKVRNMEKTSSFDVNLREDMNIITALDSNQALADMRRMHKSWINSSKMNITPKSSSSCREFPFVL